MTDLPTILSDNAAELSRLTALVNRLTDDQLAQPMEAGWTLSAVLAHLAFWDLRAMTLLEKWAKDGIGPSPIDIDLVNEVTRHLCLAIPPRRAAALCLESARNIDQVISRLTPEQAEKIAVDGPTVHLLRADHRRTHLKDIERSLGFS